jgi:MtrB/PioB family decaheme-associated outer membrane protein
MHKPQTKAMLLILLGFLLVVLLAKPVLSAQVTSPSGDLVELNSEQVKALKKQPGVYLIKHPPAGASAHLTLIELPKELGGGFLVGTEKDLLAGFDAVGVTAKDEDKPTHTLSGEVGITGRITDGEGDSAKAEEYRDLDTPVYGDLSIKYQKNDEYFIKVFGENIGRDDQYYDVIGGSYGKFKLGASYDEIPHNFAFGARNIYSGTGTGELTLSNKQDVPFPGRASRLNSLLATSESVDIGFDRKKVEANADVSAYDPFNFRVEFGREEKEGTRPYFGSFGLDNTVEIPDPIDYETTALKAIGEYAKMPLYLNLTYYYSKFKNNINTLTWDNPFRATDAVGAPSQGRIDLAPDNHNHNISVAASYMDLPLETRVTANAAWGWMVQDDDLVPYTINTAIATPPLPTDSVDAKVRTSRYHALLTSKPLNFMHIKGKFRYFDYDNNTEQIRFPGFVDADDFFIATPIMNVPTSYEKTTAGVDLGFDLYKRTKLTLGYTYEKMDRTNREVDEQEDNIFKVSLDASLFSWLNLNASYERTDRDISNYDFDVYLESGEDLEQLPGLRKYDEAAMVRDRFNFLATVYPAESLVLSGSFIYGEDDFDESPFGLLDDKHYIISLEVDYAVMDRVNLHAFYSYENYKNRQKDRGEVPSSPVVDADWFSRSEDIVNTVGAGVKVDVIPDKLNFDLTYYLSDVDRNIDFFTPAVDTAEFNTVDETRLHILEAKLRYSLWEAWSCTLGYMWEKFDYNDFNTEGFTNVPIDTSGNSNGAYLMGTLPEDYEVNIVYLRLSYSF